MKNYLRLEIGAPARLAALRKANPTDWRSARECGFHNWHSYVAALSQGHQTDGTPVWYTHEGSYFRQEHFSEECEDAPLAVRNNRGWYSDTSYSEVVRGIVGRLPHGRFIAGYLNACGERDYFPEVYDEEREAAIQADDLARIYAEDCMEHSQRSDDALKLQDTIEQKLKRLRECLALRHKDCMEYVREEIKELNSAIREARSELTTTYKDYV